MKKSTTIIFLLLAMFKIQAQNYLISFAGTGDTSLISTIKIDNLTSGDSVTLNGGDILHLTPFVGIGKLNKNNEAVQLYPNPMEGQAFLDFFAPDNDNVSISVIDLSGKIFYQFSNLLSIGTHHFRISGIPQGIYIVKVSGKSYHYSTKLLSLSNGKHEAGIEYISTDRYKTKDQLKQTGSVIEMPYKTGDRLLFKGISGRYSTIFIDVPTGNKTIPFKFVLCTDADNNNYSTVTIGTQVWMVENLKTSNYNDGTSIPVVAGSSVWTALTTPGFCWHNNDITNKNTFGALYNWYTVNTGKLAPANWHVPTDAEWKELEMALGMTQAQADETAWRGNSQGTLLKNTSGWNSGINGTNSSGFSALPGGCRGWDGYYYDMGGYCHLWSATERYTTHAWDRSLGSDPIGNDGVARGSDDKRLGLSVRCVKDK